MNKNLLIYSGLIIAAFIWGSTFVVVKELIKGMDIILLIFIRFLIASIIFLPLIKIFSKNVKKLSKDAVLKLVLTGIFGMSLNFIFQYIGLSYTTVTNSTLIIMFDPLIIITLSHIFLKEIFKKKKIIGVLLAILGSFFLITNGSLDISTHYNDLIGISFILLGEFCWCSYFIMGKKLVENYPPMIVIGYSTIFGVIFLLPITLFSTSILTLSTFSLNSWIWIFYLAISGIFAYYFYFYGLKKLYASLVGMFDYLIPVFSIILASIFLNEIITIYVIIGGILIVLGINIVQRDW